MTTHTHTPDHASQALAAADHIKAHHAVMVSELDRLTEVLQRSGAASGSDVTLARTDLVRWIASTLVPHAQAEEETIYLQAASLDRGRLLVEAMVAEHALIRELASHVDEARAPLEAATWARALYAVFESHQRKENEIILPLLLDEPSTAEHLAHHGHDG